MRKSKYEKPMTVTSIRMPKKTKEELDKIIDEIEKKYNYRPTRSNIIIGIIEKELKRRSERKEEESL